MLGPVMPNILVHMSLAHSYVCRLSCPVLRTRILCTSKAIPAPLCTVKLSDPRMCVKRPSRWFVLRRISVVRFASTAISACAVIFLVPRVSVVATTPASLRYLPGTVWQSDSPLRGRTTDAVSLGEDDGGDDDGSDTVAAAGHGHHRSGSHDGLWAQERRTVPVTQGLAEFRWYVPIPAGVINPEPELRPPIQDWIAA